MVEARFRTNATSWCQQLSTLTGISITQSGDGETITTGNGSPLVIGGQSFTLQTTTGSDGTQHVLDSAGTDITASLSGGHPGRLYSSSGPGDSEPPDTAEYVGQRFRD
jgi:flagellar hook-associated protein FlgK